MVLDVDSTLIQDEVIELLADEAGCRPEVEPPPDFVEQLVDAGEAQGATLGEAVASLKDRFFADPSLDEAEREVLARLLDGDLDAPLGDGADEQLRRACGVFLAAPQFLLGGDPGPDRAGTAVPIEVDGGSYADRCEALGAVLLDIGVECLDGSLRLGG